MSIIKIKEKQWEKIYEFLRKLPEVYRGSEEKCRRFIEGILWITRSGAQWRLLPEKYGKWNSVYKRYSRWNEKNIWQMMFEYFGADPDLENLILDSTVVRAHPCAAGASKKHGGQEYQALGRSRGGFSTKIHIGVDALGNPVRFILTPGQIHDIKEAEHLLGKQDVERVLADRSYDADEFRKVLSKRGIEAVIPPRSNRTELYDYDQHTYKERHLVECFINKIKHFRRIFSRFEKLASQYLGFLYFVGSLIWLR